MKALNNLKMGRRLGLGFAVVLTLVVWICALGWFKLQSTREGVDRVTAVRTVAEMAEHWHSLTTLNVTRTLAIAKSGNNDAVQAQFGSQIKQTSAEISKLQKALEEGANTDEERATFKAIAEHRKAYVASRDEAFKRLKAGEPEAAAFIDREMMPLAERYLAAIADVGARKQASAEAIQKSVDDEVSAAQMFILTLGGACLLIGVLVARAITVSVTGPLAHVVKVTKAIADGDLTRSSRIEGQDEVSEVLRSLQAMRQSLGGIVQEVRYSTDSIRVASSEVASGGMDLSNRTEQTASSLQGAASSMEQVATGVLQTAESASTAADLARQAAGAAQRGGAVVSQVVTTMGEINQRSQKIVDIISVIDGIAFQTNILALNAAVEAARAGEQGRGFAVVAGEVRLLAQRSAEAAKEIKSLIGASVESVEAGARLVEEAGTSMGHIVTAVEQVNHIINEITEATKEQSAGISQVNRTVGELDGMTQQNAALVEESAAAAASMKDQAARLAELVSVFRVEASRATTV